MRWLSSHIWPRCPRSLVSNETPEQRFAPGLTFPGLGKGSVRYPRLVDCEDPRRIFIYVNGACLGNGQASARAGWAFVYRQDSVHPATNCVSGRLENKGPSGEKHRQTSNRAELRAVLAALQFRHWPGESVDTLVLATNSTYVVQGCTQRVHDWEQSNWRTRKGQPVANKDLWVALLEECRRRCLQGLEVRFWWIPRELSRDAHRGARAAAAEPEVESYSKVYGQSVEESIHSENTRSLRWI